MALTVVFLSLLVDLREKQEWKDVEIWVMGKLRKRLYKLFNILARFIYPETFPTRPSKEEVFRILDALKEMKEATLNDYAYHYYFPEPLDDMSIYQLDILFGFKKYLSDLESKYSRFIDPKIRISLMEIQSYLDSLEADFNLVTKFPSSQEVVEKDMPKSILGIMKEIHKLHKLGVEIYPKQT